MSKVFYPDGHLGEYKAGLKFPEDFAEDRWLYPPGDVRRYSAVALEKIGMPPGAISFELPQPGNDT